jgi:hypothetical protein
MRPHSVHFFAYATAFLVKTEKNSVRAYVFRVAAHSEHWIRQLYLRKNHLRNDGRLYLRNANMKREKVAACTDEIGAEHFH